MCKNALKAEQPNIVSAVNTSSLVSPSSHTSSEIKLK